MNAKRSQMGDLSWCKTFAKAFWPTGTCGKKNTPGMGTGGKKNNLDTAGKNPLKSKKRK